MSSPSRFLPLRHRRDDILLLVEYFVQRYAKRSGKNIQSIDKKSLDLMRSYDWPGNIRELQNVIERSIILSSGEVLSLDRLRLSKETSSSGSRTETSPASKSGSWSEREIIEAAATLRAGPQQSPARPEQQPNSESRLPHHRQQNQSFEDQQAQVYVPLSRLTRIARFTKITELPDFTKALRSGVRGSSDVFLGIADGATRALHKFELLCRTSRLETAR